MLHIRNEIPTPATPEEAHETQIRLAREVRRGDQFKYVAGVDVAYSKDDQRAYVVAVVLSTTNWSKISEQRIQLPVPAPYEAGMLGWREAPLVLEALTRLPVQPDVILVDGSGIAHPRKFGLASHVGYALDHRTVGVAKTWPPGCRDTPATLLKRRGSKAALLHETSGEILGAELYTQDNLNPIYVSPGHRVSVEEAVSLVLRCTPWHQNPEPLRAADQAANAFCKAEEGT